VRRIANRVFAVTAVLYVLLGVLLAVNAWGQQRRNPIWQEAGKPTVAAVPVGSDDASVKAYYDYLHLRHISLERETYLGDPETVATLYGLLAVALICFYYFTFAWYARMKTADLYPVEVYNGYIAERGSPVDPFNWATYTIIVAYMAYYTLMNILYGQFY
jgi:hypothetical protein